LIAPIAINYDTKKGYKSRSWWFFGGCMEMFVFWQEISFFGKKPFARDLIL
jgi:hypothetical protein